MKLGDYIQKMINRSTNGLDITLIVLSMMLDLTTLCLFRKYMWISEHKDIDKCDVYLVMKKGGHFVSACPRRGYKVIVAIPEECRPMYITSDSMRDSTHPEDDAPEMNITDPGINYLINYYLKYGLLAIFYSGLS